MGNRFKLTADQLLAFAIVEISGTDPLFAFHLQLSYDKHPFTRGDLHPGFVKTEDGAARLSGPLFAIAHAPRTSFSVRAITP